MTFNFENLVNRSEIGNMKNTLSNHASKNCLILGGAEMDYPTAPVIRKALSEFAQRGLYGFTLPDEVYYNAICTWMKKVREIILSPDEIVVTHGTIFGLATAMRAFTNEGDGVIVQHPAYYRYDAIIKKNKRQVISNPLKEENGQYTMDFSDLENKMMNPNNKLLILCNPHNPTSTVFDKNTLKKISALSQKYDVIVFSDEIFAEITFNDHNVVSYAKIDPQNSIISTSLGKVFNLTGVNHANLIIKNHILREKYLEQRNIDHFGSIDPFFYAAVIAGYSKEGYGWIKEMKTHTLYNYKLLKERFNSQMPILSISPLEGTYVAWIDCRKLGMDDESLIDFFENHVHTIVDPGIDYGYGGSGYIRINIATSHKQIELFLDNLELAYKNRKFKFMKEG